MNLPDCLRCHPMACVLPRRFPFQNSARSEQRPFRTARAYNSDSRRQRKPTAGKKRRTRAARRTISAGYPHPDSLSPTIAHGILHMEPCSTNPKTQNPRSRKICFPSVCQLRKAQEFLNSHWITTFTEHHFIRSGNTPFGVRSLKK